MPHARITHFILTFRSLTLILKPSSDESVELRRDENVRGSAEPPRERKRTPSEIKIKHL